MIVGRWYVQLAAIWRWYLSWCVYITVFNFMLCLSIPFLYFSLIWYRWIRQNGWWYQQLFKNLCLMFVYVCFMFVIWLERGLICEKSLEMWICLWPEFDCPEVTLCGWQDIKIQLLLLLVHHKELECHQHVKKRKKEKKLLYYLLGCKVTIGKPILCVPTLIFVWT